MDSETFGRFVVTFFQSMKDWPILSLAVAGVFMLVGIPIVMLSKRLLDKLVPTRDSRMQSLLEDRGGLVEQVAQWRGTAEKALAGERSLIEQTTDLSRQLADAKKQRVSEPGADVGAELKISELERRVATLRQLLDDKSHELQERDVVAENALASQRALMDQVTDLNRRLADSQGQLEEANTRNEEVLKRLHDLERALSDAQQTSDYELKLLARVIEESIQDFFVRNGTADSPNLDDIVNLPARKVLTYSEDRPHETVMLELRSPASQISTLCTVIRRKYGGYDEAGGTLHLKLSDQCLLFPDFSKDLIEAVILRCDEFIDWNASKNIDIDFEMKYKIDWIR